MFEKYRYHIISICFLIFLVFSIGFSFDIPILKMAKEKSANSSKNPFPKTDPVVWNYLREQKSKRLEIISVLKIEQDTEEELAWKKEKMKWDKIMKIKNHYKMRLEELFKKEKSLKVLANTGKMKAQRRLGELYEKYFSYFDLDWRDKKIFYWFEKAARQGDIKSMIYITKNYFCSDQNESNLKKSLYFMRKGAELGSAEMQCVLGSIYLDIKHPLTSKIEPDRNLAIKWLGKSADQEYPYALFLIGHYLENDPSKKLKLFFRAAMKGEIQSMSQLIEMYFSGYKYGLPDDPVSAYIWNDIRKTFIVYPEDINEDYNFNLTSKQWIQANEVISFLKTEIKKKNYFASSCFQGDYSKRFEEAYPHPLL